MNNATNSKHAVIRGIALITLISPIVGLSLIKGPAIMVVYLTFGLLVFSFIKLFSNTTTAKTNV